MANTEWSTHSPILPFLKDAIVCQVFLQGPNQPQPGNNGYISDKFVGSANQLLANADAVMPADTINMLLLPCSNGDLVLIPSNTAWCCFRLILLQCHYCPLIKHPCYNCQINATTAIQYGMYSPRSLQRKKKKKIAIIPWWPLHGCPQVREALLTDPV